MPFLAPLIPFLPALIGAGGAVGGAALAKSGSKGSPLQQQLMQMMQSDAQKRDALTNTTQGGLNYFEGSDPTKTGLYKTNVATGTQSTAQAYDNAKANMRQRANMSGFGYAQPVEQGAETSLGNEEAKAQADVPRQALKDTIAPELSALNTSAGLSRDYNPAAYAGSSAGLDINRQQQQGSLFNSLFNMAGSATGDILKKYGDQTQPTAPPKTGGI